MRKPTIKEFYDETTNSYNQEEYDDAMGDYEDSERDRQIEEQWEREDLDHEERTNAD